MNLKSITTSGALMLAVLTGWSQTSADSRLMWYEPTTAKQNEQITVYFNATRGNAALKDFTGDVYAHTGVLTTESNGTGDWKHDPAWCDNDPKYKFTRSATDANIYTWTIVPSVFYNLNAGEIITDLTFVMRDEQGNRQCKTSDGGDIILAFKANQNVGGDSQLGAYVSHSDDGTTLTVTAAKGKLMLTPYNDYVIKVFTLPQGNTSAERKSITVSATPQASYTVSEDAENLTLTTASLKVLVNKATCTVSFADMSGNTILAEKGGIANGSNPRSISFQPMDDQAFYGGGYNGQRINQNDIHLTMNNTQTGNWVSSTPAPHNICIPFVVSTSGYGILVDDHYRGSQLTPSAGNGTTYQTGSLNPIAYYYVGGDGSMASVLENYTFLTGRQELPPYWALGYMTSRYGYQSEREAREVVHNIKNANLPLDGIVMDLYWQGPRPSGMGNLDWNRSQWPNPGQMMADFDAQGVKTLLITEPFFTSSTSNYTPLQNLGYFADEDVNDMGWLESSRVGLLDASNPAALDWMWNFYKARTAEGVGGWWLDLGEPERHDGDSHHKGGTVEQVHNEFGNLWIERVYRGMKEDFPDIRPFIMPRAGTSGMQRFSTFPWTGDIRRSWDGLEAQVPALLSSSMSGVAYMGSDVGGFTSNYGTDPQLYLRWVEFATFSPMMRTHSPDRPEPYLNEYSGVLNDVRRYIHMRYSYLPYTYTLAYENATKGTPLARPINFHSAAGTTAADCHDEYLWGKDILVAPVLGNTSSRRITFPEGRWVDLNDLSRVYDGNSTISYDAPLSVLPHFARQGSFITRYTQPTYTTTGEIDHSALSLTYLMSDDESATVTAKIFDDDRKSTRSLEDQAYMLTTITGHQAPNGHHISFDFEGNGYDGMPETRTMTVTIPRFNAVIDHISSTANVNRAASDDFKKLTSLSAFESAEAPAYYLADDRTLHLKAAVLTGTSSEIHIANAPSAITSIASDASGIMLEYSSATGVFSYSMPAGAAGAVITVYDVAGMAADSISGLTADGTVRQTAAARALSTGLYLATLHARNADGTPLTHTVKIAVR